MKGDEPSDWALNDRPAAILIGTMLAVQVIILAALLYL
jgi:hypothetical protein